MTVFIERAAAPIGRNAAEDAYFRQTFGSVSTHFAPRGVATAPMPLQTPYHGTSSTSLETTPRGVDPYNGHQNPMLIRKVIDDRLNAWKTNGYFNDLIKIKYNTSMVIAISYFMTIFEHRKSQDTSKPLPATNSLIQVSVGLAHADTSVFVRQPNWLHTRWPKPPIPRLSLPQTNGAVE
jgi:hypothetical protein